MKIKLMSYVLEKDLEENFDEWCTKTNAYVTEVQYSRVVHEGELYHSLFIQYTTHEEMLSGFLGDRV